MKIITTLIIILSFIINISNAQNADINLLKNINNNRNKSLDPSFRFISNSVTPLSIAFPVGAITYALIKKDSISKTNAIIISSSMALSGIVSTIVKYSVKRERPFTTYPFIDKASTGGSPSFPSGHTSAAFALATSLSISYPKWYVIAPSYIYAGLVGYSRMDLGVHYPSDVFAGALIGTASAYLCYKLNEKLFNNASFNHNK